MLDLARELKEGEMEVHALRYLGWAKYNNGYYIESLRYSLEALAVADSIDSPKMIARAYSDLGNSYCMIHNYSKATTCYLTAVEMLKEQKDHLYLSDVYRNIAESYVEASNYAEADNYYYEALKIDIGCDYVDRISDDYQGMGTAAFDRFVKTCFSMPKDSLLAVSKRDLLLAYDSSKQRGNYMCQFLSAYSLANTMIVQIHHGKYTPDKIPEVLDSCHTLIDESRSLIRKLGYATEEMNASIVEVRLMMAEGRFEKALNSLDSLTNVMDAKKKDYDYVQRNNLLLTYVEYYRMMNDYEKAFVYMAQARELSEGVNRVDMAVEAAQGVAENEFENKLHIRDIEEQKSEVMHRMHYIIMGMALVLLLMIVTEVLVVLHRKKRAFREINAKNELLEEQKIHIEEHHRDLEHRNEQITAANKEITAGINYASYIQRAVMPGEKKMEELWGDNVVALRPLRMVSGDFYWTTKVGKVKVLVVGDCTGHGVPGALLSMLGMLALEFVSSNIIASQEHLDAGAVLDELRTLVKKSLHKNNIGNTLNIDKRNGQEYDEDIEESDSMDMALILLDTETLEMHFAGAFRPLVVVRNGELITWHGDRMPIGDYGKDDVPFTDHEIQMQKDDMIYMYSDGMTDQFGYDEQMRVTKFGTKRLNDLLLTISKMPFAEQKRHIGIEMAYWRMGGAENANNLYDQTDDALLVGVKL